MKNIKDCSETIPVKVLKTAKLLENSMDVSETKLQHFKRACTHEKHDSLKKPTELEEFNLVELSSK